MQNNASERNGIPEYHIQYINFTKLISKTEAYPSDTTLPSVN
jgi:hypothetical protein